MVVILSSLIEKIIDGFGGYGDKMLTCGLISGR